MKNFLLSLLLLAGLFTQAQNFNNEWINYNQTYYKFKVGATGLYRITQPTLAGLGIGAVPAEQFQLWRNGQQVPLYTTVQTGVMGAADYIEFWGEMNDGKPDRDMYRETDFQMNDRWSLQTDTVSFFLTVNPSVANNLRFSPTPNNVAGNVLPAEPFFMHTAGKYYKDKLNPGYAAVVGEYLYSSSYDQGEGYSSFDIATGATIAQLFGNLYPYTAGTPPAPSLRVHTSGNSLNPRQVEIKVNGNQVADLTMNFFDYLKTDIPLTVAAIAGGSANVEVKNNCPLANDRIVVAKLELAYARQFNFDNANNFLFELPASAAGNYLEIAGFNHGSVNPILYDFTNGKRYIGDISNPSLVKIALEPSAQPRKLLLVTGSPSFVSGVTSLQQRNFINYAAAANQGDFLIISHPALTQGAGGTNPVEEYKNYRSSVAGGSHTARIYMIDQLTDQFGLGIKNHPLSVRNFIRWARANFSAPVKNVLLIGKGIHYLHFRGFESQPDIDRLSFIPTFGFPSSDNLLAADPGPDGIPKVSIGRISAINAEEVSTYLAKLIQYEQQQAFASPLIADKAWQKNVVHVIGASDGALGAILTNNMDKYKQIIEDTAYGANVTTFSKVSAAPVQQNSSDALYKQFEDGIGLMTYFGHSSASSLEFNLDNPNQYNNPGKYPVTIVMGCNAGNFFNYNTIRFTLKETLSEKFVLANQRGSIAFIASTHFGIVHYLDIFNTRTYTAAATTKYGMTLGEILRESIAQTYNLTTQNDYYSRFHCEQTTLHGDPAIKLNGSTPKPDYVVEDQLLKVSPAQISVAEPNFTLNAKFQNLGKAVNKDIVIELKRTYPDLTTEVIRRDTIPGIRFIDSIIYTIPIIPVRDKGLNKITVTVDAGNNVDELYETNNSVTKDVFIFEDEARPVYPYNYSIVYNQDIKLVASTANPFSGMKQYNMEMDTTEFFNSPAKITRSLNSQGGILEFTPGVPFSDSTVYYWRVAPVPVSGQPVWNTASFIYLDPAGPNVSGFGYNQSHFFQHSKSSLERMILDSASRQWKYKPIFRNLFVQMGTWVASGATTPTSLAVSIDGVPHIRLTCWFSSLQFNIINPVSFKPWQNQRVVANNYPTDLGQGLYGSTDNNCFGAEVRYYNFEYRYTDTSSRRKMMDLMRDIIPDGHYVIVRNFTLPDSYGFPIAWANDWKADEAIHGPGQSLYHYLQNAGFAGIDSFYKARPWTLIYKKNDPSFTPRWFVGDGTSDNPTMTVDCPVTDTIGYMTSPAFGPAKAWLNLKWRGKAETLPGDTATLDVIGIRNDGSEALLYDNVTTDQEEISVSFIDAAEFPYVKLRMETKDNVHYTPYQLRYWRLTYVPVPEGGVNPDFSFQFKDTVEVGEPASFKMSFKNISETDFDSLRVRMVVVDNNNFSRVILDQRKKPLIVGDTVQIAHTLQTENLAGYNKVFFEFNPENDQPEQHHFNNYAFRNLLVKGDTLNPLLDVTFDGMHILNRDIVSSKPDILIKLKDEARWLVLNDTSLLTLQVRYPDGSLRQFHFNNDTARFTPAGQAPNQDNVASVSLRPHFLEDGEYELIVTGKDRSNNKAGNIEYRVLFQVINTPMISNLLNYPNPFTTSTAFVFTLTGSEVPQNIKIEIMTVTGKIVREITKDELGPLHIGRNITEFKWDGTDQYGQKLANGIYLYRVITNLNGKALDRYRANGDNTDKYFNKGYGKMYLMR